MAYIGAEPVPGQNREVDDISSGFNGNATAFTLQVSSVNVSPESANNILINLGGVLQNPGTDYTVNASTLTFTTAPANGLSFFGLILGAGINTATVADGTISTAKIVDQAVDLTKLPHGTGSNDGKFLRANNGADPSFETVGGDFGSQNIVTTGSATIGSDLIHSGDTDTKISFGTDSISVNTGGTERLAFGSSAVVFNDSGASVDFRVEGDSNANLLFVDASADKIGVGTNGPTELFSVNGGHIEIRHTAVHLDFMETGATDTNHRIRQNAGNILIQKLSDDKATSTDRVTLDGGDGSLKIDGIVKIGTATEGNQFADDLTVANSAQAGITIRSGSSSTGNIYFSDATSGGGEAAGYFEYDHNTNNLNIGTNENQRVVVQSDGDLKIDDGDLVIGTAGHGIDFSASANNGGMVSEILNDYERGTFTATITGIGGGTNPTFSAQTSSSAYIKVGDVVHFWIYIFDINCTNTGSGIITTVSGLPFASGGHYYPGVVSHNTVIGNGNVNSGYVQPNNSSPHFIPIVGNSTNGAVANVGNPLYIMIGGTYTSTVV